MLPVESRLRARRSAPFHIQIELTPLDGAFSVPGEVLIHGKVVRRFRGSPSLEIGDLVSFPLYICRDGDEPTGPAYVYYEDFTRVSHMEAYLYGSKPDFQLAAYEFSLLDHPSQTPVMSEKQLEEFVGQGSSNDETAGREDRIDEIVAAYLDGRHDGSKIDRRPEILARYPEFEKELREFFESEDPIIGILNPPDLPPAFGDDYEILSEIGRGGMGIVYKCHQKSLNKIVAIKTILGGSFDTPPNIEGIRKEAQKAASLMHPNIVTVHHVGEHNGQPFFVMDYIEGASLADIVAEPGLDSFQAVQFLQTITAAVHYAHQRQILHCDLKPANILLDDEGKAYVTDFGLAKRLGEDGKYLPQSAAGGTAAYMAPEQAIDGELTTATDIYGSEEYFMRCLPAFLLSEVRTCKKP